MSEKAKLILADKEYELPILEGTEREKAIDITKLRDVTGYITADSGYKNTGATMSAITFLDGEKGILRYRGYPIEQLAEHSSFLEVSYLLIYGELPKKSQLEEFANKLKNHSLINEKMLRIMEDFPTEAHPMVMLASSVCALNAFYPDVVGSNQTEEQVNLHITRLIAKLPTLITWNYKLSKKQPVNYPRLHLDYCSNFLSMMFSDPKSEYEVDPAVAKALDVLLILHADHEQNCSTSTVRLVGSSKASLYASISAGICALWGPLHGGANQEVIEMLDKIKADGGNVKKWIEIAKDKNSGFRLSGFGHRVYKNFDPRAKIIKKACDDVLNKLGIDDPTLDIAKQLEQAALEDDYFKERKLYPNVDFYSGIIYRALGIPTNMFTVMFALGRLPGWIAQWKEMIQRGEPIGRPRQIYIGATERNYVPISAR